MAPVILPPSSDPEQLLRQLDETLERIRREQSLDPAWHTALEEVRAEEETEQHCWPEEFPREHGA